MALTGLRRGRPRVEFIAAEPSFARQSLGASQAPPRPERSGKGCATVGRQRRWLRNAGSATSERRNATRHFIEHASTVGRVVANAVPQTRHSYACGGFARLARIGLHLSEQTVPCHAENCTKCSLQVLQRINLSSGAPS
jgi:hypothetical protein